jgi:hypothetical protein
MQHDPCIFYWQEKLANSRTPSAPRSGRIIKPHYKDKEVSARRSPPRSRPRCVHADYPCEDFLDRRQCLAVAQIPRGQQQARRAGLDRVRRICAQQIARHFINRGRMPCQVFSLRWLRPDPRRRRRPCRRDNGRIGQRRSVVKYRRGGFEMRAGRRERQRSRDNREGTMPLSSKAIERVLSARRHGYGTGLIYCRGQTDRAICGAMVH